MSLLAKFDMQMGNLSQKNASEGSPAKQSAPGMTPGSAPGRGEVSFGLLEGYLR